MHAHTPDPGPPNHPEFNRPVAERDDEEHIARLEFRSGPTNMARVGCVILASAFVLATADSSAVVDSSIRNLTSKKGTLDFLTGVGS